MLAVATGAPAVAPPRGAAPGLFPSMESFAQAVGEAMASAAGVRIEAEHQTEAGTYLSRTVMAERRVRAEVFKDGAPLVVFAFDGERVTEWRASATPWEDGEPVADALVSFASPREWGVFTLLLTAPSEQGRLDDLMTPWVGKQSPTAASYLGYIGESRFVGAEEAAGTACHRVKWGEVIAGPDGRERATDLTFWIDAQTLWPRQREERFRETGKPERVRSTEYFRLEVLPSPPAVEWVVTRESVRGIQPPRR